MRRLTNGKIVVMDRHRGLLQWLFVNRAELGPCWQPSPWRRLQRMWKGVRAPIVLLSLSHACMIETDHDRPGPCDRLRCSTHGYCQDGECLCNPGRIGDPYAEHGCQPPGGTACATTCGLNAYCDGRECLCARGFVAVCGTGDCLAAERLCDGVADCHNEADEARAQCEPDVEQTWDVVDGCDDGVRLEWNLWSQTRAWAWPGASLAFTSPGYGLASRETIACVRGEIICLGAQAGELVYGVGLDGTLDCDSCCFSCSTDSVEFGWLECS